MLRDPLFNRGKVQLTAPADSAGAAVKSKILDVQSAVRAMISVNAGVMTGFVAGTNYLTPTLQESDTTNDADFTDVAAGDISDLSSTGALTANSVYRLGYLGIKRYIRVNCKLTGTLTASVVGITGEMETGILDAQANMPAAITAT